MARQDTISATPSQPAGVRRSPTTAMASIAATTGSVRVSVVAVLAGMRARP